MISQEDSFLVIDDFFRMYGLVRQQLDSYNTFVNTTIQHIVDEYQPYEFYPKKSVKNRAGFVSVILWECFLFRS